MQKIQLGEQQIREAKSEKKNKRNELFALIEIQSILKDMGHELKYDLSKEKTFKAYDNKLNIIKKRNKEQKKRDD